MKIIVLGSGVVGVTSAWYLNQAGHEVTVIDRAAEPAQETSFGNAGQLSYGYSSPWAAPGVPFKAIKWLFQKHAPLSVKPFADGQQPGWMLKFLAGCTAARYAVNKGRMERVSKFSQQCFGELRKSISIDYEGRERGTVQLFRTQHQVDVAQQDMKVLDAHGLRYEVLDRAGIVKAEPGLAHSVDKFVGALRLPDDETGDCRLFTTRLAQLAAEQGVKFQFNTRIDKVDFTGDTITGVDTAAGRQVADAYVMALGPHSRAMLLPLGLRLPVYPLKGYSLTVPIVDESRAPVSTVMDETHKVAITRFANRIRVGGMAEIRGFDLSLNPKRRATLEMVVNDVFPGAGDTSKATFWTGLRPATPDGTPIIGATPFKNLYTNTGHGTLGWTMSAGSACYLAALMSGQTLPMDSEGLDVFRYMGHPKAA
ncbi:MAG TPA: D-amino acid dehydrogenase [Nevskiaceae bacterium]|nr:D-amino acid dehydrogenase [Nevskiaceae bacterium]